MWYPETPLRDDGHALMVALDRDGDRAGDTLHVGGALRGILGWRSIAACLLKIPTPIVASAASTLKGRVALPAISEGIANVAVDLEHKSVNSVHVMYALLHVAHHSCSQFLRRCNRLQLDGGDDSDEEAGRVFDSPEAREQAEAAARQKRIVGRNVLTPPFVELALTRYLTSVWYPFDGQRFDNYRRLAERNLTGDAQARTGVELEAFSLTLEHARPPHSPPQP